MQQSKQAILQHLEHARQIGVIDLYRKAARKYDIPVAVLLAKDSKESWLGSYPNLAENDWYGSDGRSRGISQLNVDEFPVAKMMDGDAHQWFINTGAKALRNELNRFNGNMMAALAAYNAGASNVRSALESGQAVDSVTTHGNYASGVLQRAEVIKQELSFLKSLLPVPISFGPGGNAKEAFIKGIPAFLILSAGAYYVKDLIDKKTKR